MTRGVVYIVWGDFDRYLERSMASVRQHHPDLPIHVQRVEAPAGDAHSLVHKASMARFSPFETTAYLDADTVVLGDLTFGFAMAERHGIACCVCESPWLKRYRTIDGRDDGIEYQAGVIFFDRQARSLFDWWELNIVALDSSLLHYDGVDVQLMSFNDQLSFSLAIARHPTPPFVLPLNWNFRPDWHRAFFGPLKIWHAYDEVPDLVRRICDHYRDHPRTVIQFHEI